MNKNKKIIISVCVVVLICALLFVFNKQIKTLFVKDQKNTIIEVSQQTQPTVTEEKSNTKPADKVLLSRDQLVVKAFEAQQVKNYTSAENYMKEALEHDPKNPNLMQVISSIYNMDKKYIEAMNWIDQALAINKTNEIYWETKIEITKNLYAGKKESITAVYKDAIANSEVKINMVTSYATYLESIKDIQSAIQQWQKAIELYPKNKDAYQSEINKLK